MGYSGRVPRKDFRKFEGLIPSLYSTFEGLFLLKKLGSIAEQLVSVRSHTIRIYNVLKLENNG